jgi:hypothetical protein
MEVVRRKPYVEHPFARLSKRRRVHMMRNGVRDENQLKRTLLFETVCQFHIFHPVARKGLVE